MVPARLSLQAFPQGDRHTQRHNNRITLFVHVLQCTTKRREYTHDIMVPILARRTDGQ